MAAEPTDSAGPPGAGSQDGLLEEVVRRRFDHVLARWPVLATWLGRHEHDHRLPDGTRDAIQQDIADGRRYVAELEAIEPARLSPHHRVERDLALHATRLELFDEEAHRLWERRLSGADELGDAIFLLFARETRPFEERLDAIAGRLAGAPRWLDEQRSRLGERPMRLWNELEAQVAGSLPALFGAVMTVAVERLGADHPEVARLDRAADGAAKALEGYSGWLRDQLGRADDDFALGRESYEALVDLRAFDGLSSEDILEIGLEQLHQNREARRRIAAEVDPSASEHDVLDRIKSDHPADFDAALLGYRRAMAEAREFVAAKDIATIPPNERLSVIATPEYLRRSMPFAAYFSPPRFETQQEGIYVVTPSVDDDPGAMREHNWASIYNTSIHEAYPGHHQQLTAANAHPSLVRPLVDAPEFVEGWAMYCEQMMREQGFDDSPTHRLMMHTDAIWRACRIVLDVRLHRRQLDVAEAIEFLVDNTGFERPNARAEVERYTYTPTYQLSYLLGKVLLLRLRADEQARLGDRFSLRRFHDTLLAAGSIPISFQRRLLAQGDGPAPAAG